MIVRYNNWGRGTVEGVVLLVQLLQTHTSITSMYPSSLTQNT